MINSFNFSPGIFEIIPSLTIHPLQLSTEIRVGPDISITELHSL